MGARTGRELTIPPTKNLEELLERVLTQRRDHLLFVEDVHRDQNLSLQTFSRAHALR